MKKSLNIYLSYNHNHGIGEFSFIASERKFLFWVNHIGNDEEKGNNNDDIF